MQHAPLCEQEVQDWPSMNEPPVRVQPSFVRFVTHTPCDLQQAPTPD